jgi:HK97 family phage major capsid protein
MLQKRLNEIEARKAELRKEIDSADEKRLAEIKEETDKLMTEEQEIRAKMELTGKLGAPEQKPEARGVEPEAEKRGRALKEQRSVTIATTGIVLPEYQASDIKPTFNEVSSLVDGIGKKFLKGGESFKQPYLKGYGTADYTTEGGNPATAEPTFGYAEITKTKIAAYAEDTEELLKLPAADYGNEVVKGISIAIRKKLNREILFGDGDAGHFVGIFDEKATAISADTDIDFAEIDEETLDTIIYSYGGDEDVESVSVLILNKQDLKAFAMLRDSNGRKIHEVKAKGNYGTIDGVPFIINSNCKAISDSTTGSGDYCMAYGPLSNYTMGIFSDLEVSRSTDYKFKEGMVAHRGVIFAGGNVTAHNGFLRVKRT